MNKTTLTKIFSTTLSLALAVTSAPLSAGAAGPLGAPAPAFVAKLTPPEQFGYVASSFAPHNEEHPRLIVIADLHGHVDVQKNIMGILDHSVKSLTSTGWASPLRRVPLFVEGGWEKNLEEPLRAIKNSKVRAFLTNYFLHKSELQAAQAYSERNVGSGNITLTGVENKEEYLAHKKHFAQTYPGRRTVLQAIVKHEAALKALQSITMDGSFAKLQSLRDQYMKGQIAPEYYARALSRLAHRVGVAGTLVKTLQNARTAPAGDLDMALLEVHNRVSQKLAAGRPLTAYLRRSLGNEAVLRQNLALIDAHMDLLKRTISNQLTPEEVPVAMAKLPQLERVARILLDGEALDVNLTTVLRDALDFYPYAFLRDESLVANSLAALDKDETHASTGILIAGGFHSAAISDYLQKHQVPFVMIYPTVAREVTAQEQFNYIKRMCDEHVTVDELAEDYARPARLDVAQKDAVDSAMAATVPPTAVNPKTPGGTSGLLDALATPAEALLAQVPGANVSPVHLVNPSLAATLDVKGGELVARDNSKSANVAIALTRLLSPILEKAGVGANGVTKTIEINAVDADITSQISFKNDTKSVTWNRGPAIVEGIGTAHVKISIKKDWVEALDLDSLGALFKAETASGLQEGKFGAKQKAAAQAVYALAHEIAHAFTGKNEQVPVLSVVAAIGLVAGQAGLRDGASGLTDTTVQIPTAFAQRFVEAASEVLPEADFAGAINTASQAGTLSVAGLAETTSNVLEPVILGDAVEQKLAQDLQNMEPQASREDAMFVLQQHLNDPSFALTGRISPAKWKEMAAALIERMKNAQFKLNA